MAKQPSIAVISRNVAALRNAQKWSQAELAKKAGVSQKVISNLENADELGIHPTLYTVIAVAKALNVSFFALMLPISVEQLQAIQDPNIARLIDVYMELPPTARQTVDHIINLEMQAAMPPAYQADQANQARRILSPPPTNNISSSMR